MDLGRGRCLPEECLSQVPGFGDFEGEPGYVFLPTSVDELRSLLLAARAKGRRVVLRGAGRSYGDAAYRAESMVLELTRMDRILDQAADGVVTCQPGVRLEDLWRFGLPRGWWPAVVSGTARTTIGGAVAMDIHGKNAHRDGTFGEQLVDLVVLRTDGELVRLGPDDPRFWGIVGGLGLAGVVVEARVRMRRVANGGYEVTARSCRSWDDQFAAFRRDAPAADALVSWVDIFGNGRGLFHSAVHGETGVGLDPERQLRGGRLLGLWPRSESWRLFRLVQSRAGMRVVNAAKYRLAQFLARGKRHPQTLAEFNFLLDALPGWERAYAPEGLVQFQAFVPAAHAQRTFEALTDLQRAARLESYLAVMKQHRAGRSWLTYSVDGFSLALDFPLSAGARLGALHEEMARIVAQAEGRFFLAKDLLLNPSVWRRTVDPAALARFGGLRAEMDPAGLLTSALAERLNLPRG